MKLTDLFLNRYLYRESKQTLETQETEYFGGNAIAADVPAVASGGAAQDINISNVNINANNLAGPLPTSLLDVSNWGWGQTCAFSSASATQVNWGSGVFTSASGVTYSISAGNTGVMSAKTYIYLDLNVSLTAYQTTTTSANSVGIGKVLVAVAKNDTTTATYNLSEATQIVGDNILANSINASKITTGQLIVGTNVGLGTAQDSSGVTTIIGNTVTTGFVNALSVTAGSVSADDVTAGTITGSTLQTATSGHRVVIDGSADNITFYNSSGTATILLQGAGTTAGDTQVSIGGGLYLAADTAYNTSDGARLYSGYNGIGVGGVILVSSGATDAYFFFQSNGRFDADSIQTDSINLNGTTRTSWPTSGTTTLSGLSIDTDKDWNGYNITDLDEVTLSGSGSFIDCNTGYLDNVRALYFDSSNNTNPSIEGEMRYKSGSTAFRGYVNSTLYQFTLFTP
jgi:hypothetical protein